MNTLDISHWYLTLAHAYWNSPSDKIVAFFSRHVTSSMTRIRTMRHSKTTLSVHPSMRIPASDDHGIGVVSSEIRMMSRPVAGPPRARFWIESAEMSIDRMRRNFTGDRSSRRSSTDWAVWTIPDTLFRDTAHVLGWDWRLLLLRNSWTSRRT